MTAISKKNIQEKIPIPSGLSSRFKDELGARILEEVRARTGRGIDKNGKNFKKYSESYKDSLDFKNAGKSLTVNLESTGDMLAELDIISIGSTSITIGYKLEHEDAGKVQGNVLGEYGNDKPVTRPRDFIGLPSTVVNRIIAQMRTEPEFREVREDQDTRVKGILAAFFK